MPDIYRPSRRHKALGCAAALIGLLAAPAGTSQAADPAREPESKVVAKGEAVDPLQRLQSRLAVKLGVSSVAPVGQGGAMRIASRSAPAEEHAAAKAPASPSRHRSEPPHWDYEGPGGPQAWAQLRPEFAQCAKGRRQSPIDIQGGIRVQLEPVAFDYKPGPFRVVDNGHTVQVNVAPNNWIEVMGRRFELQQFHFHRPSEEKIDGRQFEMVVHLVHKDLEGRLAVVAVLLERGAAQPVVQTVWNNLPLEKGDEIAVRAGLDPAGLLPTERSYYTYMGSLTTPPCSEGVLWMVMKSPLAVSAEQLGIFARLYPMNARPIQAASGRLIKESN